MGSSSIHHTFTLMVRSSTEGASGSLCAPNERPYPSQLGPLQKAGGATIDSQDCEDLSGTGSHHAVARMSRYSPIRVTSELLLYRAVCRQRGKSCCGVSLGKVGRTAYDLCVIGNDAEGRSVNLSSHSRG